MGILGLPTEGNCVVGVGRWLNEWHCGNDIRCPVKLFANSKN